MSFYTYGVGPRSGVCLHKERQDDDAADGYMMRKQGSVETGRNMYRLQTCARLKFLYFPKIVILVTTTSPDVLFES